VLINPEIVSLGSELRLHEEGCLSIPDVRVEIERPGTLVVRYLDRDGKQRELTAEGLQATAIQHEIDHLNGKLIIDFLSSPEARHDCAQVQEAGQGGGDGCSEMRASRTDPRSAGGLGNARRLHGYA
jgi:peptide deformylase